MNRLASDNTSKLCIDFILEQIKEYTKKSPGQSQPIIIGFNGVQGSGKTTLVDAVASTLNKREGLVTLVCSIDNFYLKRDDQLRLIQRYPENRLVQVRGQPGTHDTNLLRGFFQDICAGRKTKVPQYDKAAFSGQGDRITSSRWEVVNDADHPKVQVILLEGWCVGFRPLSRKDLHEKWSNPSRTLKLHKLEHLEYVNSQLEEYEVITNLLNSFIHLDAENTEWVYTWRLEQEVALRQSRGGGMTDHQVQEFIDAYYPAYEMYLDNLRKGIFADTTWGKQLRIVIDKDRNVTQTNII
ncbi:D-glycerate 3-kinase [Mariannaea sp. PMI_226]|nr:D-glycerate 3-kinase [Mariannaea sp. PMI_226]